MLDDAINNLLDKDNIKDEHIKTDLWKTNKFVI